MSHNAETIAEQVAWLRPHAWHHAAPGHRLIRRGRLSARLSAAPGGGVVLVCGPAGSGKSMLLRSWVEAEDLGGRVAWVSVERGERDGQRFWVAVVHEVAAAVSGDRLVRHVSPAPGLLAHVVVERLLADLQALEHPVVLVIDDLHELDSTDGLDCLELFLQRVPAQMRVALGTRVEPRLGLHRLRLEGVLTEIRDPDLRFSIPETRELLEEAGISLSDGAVALLHHRTEGWAAGLRLAAITLAGHPDPERFVTEFCGGDRNVGDYLLAEVLERRTPEARDLLLRTSVLDRVSGPLADVLTGGSGSERILQCLEDHNAFVTALDAGRSWFRYHRLFADLLERELRRTDATIIRPLHRAAARWYEQHEYVVEATRHAQAGHDWSHAGRMLAEHFLDLTLDGRAATIHALLAAFPTEAQATDAELAIAFTGAAIMDGAVDEADVHIRHAEGLATGVPAERRRRFDLRVSGMRVWLACWRGDLEALSEAMRSLQAALAAPMPQELALDKDVYAMALVNLGTAELWASQLEDARRDLQRALALARRIRRPYLEISCLAYLGLASVLNGSPFSVMVELADEAVTIGESNGWGEHPVLASALAVRGTAYVWLGRFQDAERSLDRAERTLRHDREPGLVFLLQYGGGLLRFAQGRLDDALAAFRAAEGVQRLLASEHALGVALQSRLVHTHVALGDTVAARACLAGIDPQLRDRTVLRVSEAALCLAEGRPQDAVDVVAPALEPVDEPIRFAGSRIQALLYDAVARDRLGDPRAAERSLDRALELATTQRLILPFVLPPARDLLKDHPRRRTADPAQLTAILEVLAGCSPPTDEAMPRSDELSPAELRVLSYLPGSLKADEIAGELYLSANTVRTHLRHIYAKLDAHTRREAVTRARERGLFVRR
ncbi:AAA family ATPase [Candidatus Solirubrobacter pratensis]|uniref:AAA family ATPase n=1 Tax=Candidatus Solirubrobacter pratensis TaxID=1298857 RepID=UPI0003FE2DE4|nr:AAA family ATPase [Candidatus Solirubrobacter pratensis]